MSGTLLFLSYYQNYRGYRDSKPSVSAQYILVATCSNVGTKVADLKLEFCFQRLNLIRTLRTLEIKSVLQEVRENFYLSIKYRYVSELYRHRNRLSIFT